jgi:RNA polymerase sigma factor (sigma-70 family)
VSAGRQLDERSVQALACLCERYWYPLYAYVRRRGYTAAQAQDLTQEFFARLLEKRYIDRADPSKGRFRSFLLSSLTCFLFDEADRGRALKRGGSHAPLSFEFRDGEEMYRREPSHTETPERIFERRWAQATLERVLARLRAEFAAGREPAHFERLKGLLLGADADLPYAAVARELGITEGALKVAVHRLRKRYRAVLRAEIAETVSDPAEIEGEIRYLANALAAT